MDRIKALFRRPKSGVGKDKPPAAERESAASRGRSTEAASPRVKGQKRNTRKRARKTGKRKRPRSR